MAIIIMVNKEEKYKRLKMEVLEEIGFPSLSMISYFDEEVIVKSRQTLEKYDDIKFFKENREKLKACFVG